MTSTELSKLQRVQFRLAGKLVQGLVIGDKRKKVVIMKDHGGGNWHPVFIPLDLLSHINFQLASKLFMPVYNPIMEGILEQARRGETDGW
jgi:hypothetical protein